MKEETIKELSYVDHLLKLAEYHNLEAEVVVFALKAMKSDPLLSVEEAMALGYEEWIKQFGPPKSLDYINIVNKINK